MNSASSREQGFTLVELLVALLIFGMIAAAGVALLSFSVRAQDMADARLDDVAAMRRVGALLTGDLAQAAARVVRNEAGAVKPAFVGGTGAEGDIALALVRRGWDNPDGAGRPSLQKVEYRLTGVRLERIAYRNLDGAAPMEPVTVLEGVEALRLRYRDSEGEWRERWDPTQITDLPRAVEMIVDVRDGGPVRQLFLVGAGL
ncbi:type II secretion system minor pseudopilin GspJ [Sphingosinicella humi]|uniref:Type II secretion system protein J n=1 Tax=Allosphingosinicella humi TaxID=2068657 RepID=A0A2U2IZM4_9SPHN|nr:type II secretion system minor pseudopilin GspJ [Sphingosinicella humi]PWG01524.1 type II secretion system protein GspJ [Sphingosinicella humi]